jgi:hypothetical protein
VFEKYQNSTKDLLQYLYDKWYDETKYDSSMTKFENSYFDGIVSLGYGAVPGIIEMLKEKPSLLVAALNKITGKNPVKPSHRGKIKEMSDDWINWWEGKNHAG